MPGGTLSLNAVILQGLDGVPHGPQLASTSGEWGPRSISPSKRRHLCIYVTWGSWGYFSWFQAESALRRSAVMIITAMGTFMLLPVASPPAGTLSRLSAS